MRHGFKENQAREALHFLNGLLHLPPVGDGALQPLVMFLGKSHTHRLALYFARPLITGSSGAGASILGIALIDPPHLSQTRLETPRILPAIDLIGYS